MSATQRCRRLAGVLAALALLCPRPAKAAEQGLDGLPPGRYPVRASLSCYVGAMGGVEFGAPLLTGADVTAASDGSQTLTLYLTKSSVTIYGVTCDTFVDDTPAQVRESAGPARGTVGYYDLSGVLQTEGVHCTHSTDTALDPQNTPKHYVDTVSFPLSYESDTYALSLFVNSNVMGTQFSADTYPAVLRVDWGSLSAEEPPAAEAKAAESAAGEKALEPAAEAETPPAAAGEGEAGAEEAAPAAGAAEREAADGGSAQAEERPGLHLYPGETAKAGDGTAQEAVPQEISAETSAPSGARATPFRTSWAVGAGLIGLGVLLIGSEKRRKET